jgi:PUA domain
VSTWDHVLIKLQGGADLMTPGLTSWNQDIKSGDIVAITLQNNIPVAVGVAAFDIGRLSKAAGEKGKAVFLVHCYNDELWAVGSKTRPPTDTPHETQDDSQLEEATQQLTLEQTVDNEADLVTPEGNVEEPLAPQSEQVGNEPSVSGLCIFILTNVQRLIMPLKRLQYTVSTKLKPQIVKMPSHFHYHPPH